VESDWRWNVYLFHMQNSNLRLCARVLDDPEFFIAARAPFPNPRYEVWHHPDPELLPTFVGDFAVPALQPHFPYDWVVEPD